MSSAEASDESSDVCDGHVRAFRVARDDCRLPPGDQTRNLALFAANQALIYLGAPVMYVGILQAALLQKLGASPLVANLPATVSSGRRPPRSSRRGISSAVGSSNACSSARISYWP